MSDAHSPSLEYRAEFELSVVNAGRRSAWLRATGELDLAATEALARLLAQQLDAGHRFVRLDMSAVTFLDCACLVVLVNARHRFVAATGTLVLTGAGAPVTRLLKLTGLDDTLFATAVVTGPIDRRVAAAPRSKSCNQPPGQWFMQRQTPTAARA